MALIGTVEVDESALEQIIANYLEYNSYMTHSGVTDVVEEHVKDNIDVSSEIEQYLSDGEYQTESDVQRLIDNMGFLTDSEVRDLISENEPEVLDDDDVERIVTHELTTRDLVDLPRRFEQYAQRVDDLRGENLGTRIQSVGERVIEQGHAIADLHDRTARLEGTTGHSHAQDHDVVTALVQRIERLETDAHSDNDSIIKLTQQVQDLRAQMGERIDEVEKVSGPATEFFKLAVRMLNIIRVGL